MVAKKKRILIIDDERDMVNMLQMRLEAANYEVLSSCDGKEGLEKAKKERPDLIILDIMMPKMNGYQVCRTLKSNDATKSIFVIMLSAKSQESDKFWGKETGADDYIVKPFEDDLLLKKIKEFLKI